MSRWGSEPAPSRGWGWQRPHGATPPDPGPFPHPLKGPSRTIYSEVGSAGDGTAWPQA